MTRRRALSPTWWIFLGLCAGVIVGGFLPEDAHPLATLAPDAQACADDSCAI